MAVGYTLPISSIPAHHRVVSRVRIEVFPSAGPRGGSERSRTVPRTPKTRKPPCYPGYVALQVPARDDDLRTFELEADLIGHREKRSPDGREDRLLARPWLTVMQRCGGRYSTPGSDGLRPRCPTQEAAFSWARRSASCRRPGSAWSVLSDAPRPDRSLSAATTDVRKAWMWEEFPEIAKKLNDVADDMAARGFREEAADLFERWGERPRVIEWVGGWVGPAMRGVLFGIQAKVAASLAHRYLSTGLSRSRRYGVGLTVIP